MDFQEIIQYPFVWGLLLGLLVAGFVLKGSMSAKRQLRRDVRRIEGEKSELQGYLNTQMSLTAGGNQSLINERDQLKQQNENLRVNLATLQTKPEKGEARQYRVQELAVRSMREQAPGFAGAWEKALRSAEAEIESAEGGFTKLVRRVVPGLAAPRQGAGGVQGIEDSASQK